MSDFTRETYDKSRDSTEDKPLCLSNYISDRLIEIPLIEIFPQIKTCMENYLQYGWEGLAETYKSGKEINFDDVDLNKRCKVEIAYVPIVLRALGVIRVKLITHLFECIRDKESDNYIEKEYLQTALGSTNLTSDHDITIGGPYPSNIVWKMYSDFVNQYKITLPYVFDSNLYCSAVYNIVSTKLHDVLLEKPEKRDRLLVLNVNDENMKDRNGHYYKFYTPNITEHDEIHKQYLFGFLKLKNIPFIGGDRYSNIKSIIGQATNIEDQLNILNKIEQSWIQENNDLSQINISTFNKVEKQNAVDYYLQCHFSKPLEHYYHSDEVYSEVLGGIDFKNSNSIIAKNYNDIKKTLYKKDGTPSDTGTAGIVGYYSSEAYYTAAAVQIVVLEMQMKFNFKDNIEGQSDFQLDEHTYLTALLENLGDYYTHSHHEVTDFKDVLKKTDDVINATSSSSEPNKQLRVSDRKNKYKKIFIKYSKYMKRVLYCLTKLKEKKTIPFNERGFNVDTLNTHIDKVIERRKDYNITDVEGDTLYRTEYGWAHGSWNQNTFVEHVLDIINEISAYSDIKKYYIPEKQKPQEESFEGGKKNKSYRKRNKNKKQRSYKKH
jgi:hypothetical protein